MIQSPTATEVERRTAISRAYYYLFHETRDFVSPAIRYRQYVRSNPNVKGAHEKIANFLVSVNYIIGNSYKDFRDDRNTADYDLHIAFDSHADCITKVRDMANLLSTIKNLKI